jgi:serine/threonine-protein kinase
VQDGANSEHAMRFLREAMLTSRIDHPNVISAIDYGTFEDGTAYLVMSLVEGPTLARVMEIERPMSWVRAAEIAAQIADAVAAAQAEGIVHRDLKPENVLLRSAVDGWEPIIIDLGIAKWLAQETATASGSVFGTPHYMSPEQCRDTKSVGPATDRYAMAIIAFELLAGRRPYEGRTIPELLRQHLESPVPELMIPRRLRAGGGPNGAKTGSTYATPNLDAFMKKAMAKEPRLRYGSSEEMSREFEKAARADGLFEPADPADLAPLFPPAPHPIAEIILDGEPRQRFDLRHGPLVLGRHEACQVVLNSPRLSRLHAAVYLHRGRIWAADLHSQNGTLFQGRALAAGVPMPFTAGGQTTVYTLYNRNLAVRLSAP